MVAVACSGKIIIGHVVAKLLSFLKSGTKFLRFFLFLFFYGVHVLSSGFIFFSVYFFEFMSLYYGFIFWVNVVFFFPFKLRLSFFFIGDCHLFQFKSDMAHFNDNSFFNIILIAT